MTDVFSGLCNGFGFVEMEGHEARAAIAGINGQYFNGNPINVTEPLVNSSLRGTQ